jgi:hypothetical protein
MDIPMKDAYAGFPIGNERLAVAGANFGCEQIEIATKIEHPRRARAEQQVSQVVGTVLERRQNAALPRVEVVQQIEVIAWPPAWSHEGPERAGRVVPGNLQLLKLEQSPGIGDFLQIDKLRIEGKFRLRGRNGRSLDPHCRAGIRHAIHRNFRPPVNAFFTLTKSYEKTIE